MKDVFDLTGRKVMVGDVILISEIGKRMSKHLVLKFTATGLLLSRFEPSKEDYKRCQSLISTTTSVTGRIKEDKTIMYNVQNAEYNDIQKHNSVMYHYFLAPYSIYIVDSNVDIPRIFNKYLK